MAITTATQAATIVNESLSNCGYQYQIDTTSGQTIEDGFKAIGAMPPEMMSNIVSAAMKILVSRSYTSMFSESKNPMRRFWRDAVAYGGGIEEIFIKLIEAEDGFWADADQTEADAQAIAKDLVSFKKDEILTRIHPVTDQFRIKMSISDLEYSKLFTPNGFANFIDAKMANFQQSAEAKLMDIGIKCAQRMISDDKVVQFVGLGLDSANDVTGTVETINTVSDGMKLLSTAFNYDNVKTTSDTAYLMCTPEFINRIKSRGYANAFNLEEYRNNNTLIILPYGTKLGTGHNNREIGAMLLDPRSILVAVRYWNVQPFIVSNTDYRNTFLKAQLIVDYNTFFNAVAFETGEVGNFNSGDSFSYIINYNDSPGSAVNTIRVNGKLLTDYPLALKNGGTNDEPYWDTYEVPTGSFIEFSTVDSSFTNNPYYIPRGGEAITMVYEGSPDIGNFYIDGIFNLGKAN